jgi:hypothetical protein
MTFRQAAVIVVTSVVMGVTIVTAPVVTWGLLGILVALLLLQFSVETWITAAVLSATFSRFLVATGFVPAILNFFHFPLAVAAAFVAVTRSAPRLCIARTIGIGCVAMLLLSFVSWLFSGGEFLRPLLTWLVFLEPFLIIYALVRVPPPLVKQKFLWKLTLAIPFAQLPPAMWQAFTLGLGDYVQGSFVGMGAGHHMAGSVALTGTLILVARYLSGFASKTTLLCAIALLIIPILADAKQNIIASLPALLLLVVTFRSLSTRLLVGFSAVGIAILAAFLYYRPLQIAFDRDVINQALLTKVESFNLIAGKAGDNAETFLFGLGPGNSVSRVALMGMEEYIKADSPVSFLALQTAPLTPEIWAVGASTQELSRSSVLSGISSWLGLLGDLGVVGLGLYLWMCWKLWQNLRGSSSWEVGVAKAVMVMTGLLGAIYSWLEEPGLTLLAGLVIGLGLLASDAKNAPVQNLSRS